MTATFYDVKLRKKVEVDVTEKIVYGDPGKERYALKAKTITASKFSKIDFFCQTLF